MTRFFIIAILAMSATLTLASAQTKSQAVPTCQALQAGQPIARIQSYVELPIFQLKKMVPALSGIKLEAGENGAGNSGAENAENKTASILRQTGAVVANMLHRMPNLIAREEVRQPDSTFQEGGVAALNSGRRINGGMPGSNVAQYKFRVFNYRIVPKTKLDGRDALDEFRTDAHDHPIDESARNPDNPQSVGYATTWVFFFPGNFQESAFRYLGQQKIGNRETYVVAFAQVPDKTALNAVVDSGYGRCSTSSQGIAWIDQSTFQIVRMQTDLLSPQPAIKLNQLRSIISYSEVKIPERSLLLWLPKDVEVTWQSADRAGEELHTYSKYRLFASTIRILPPDEPPPR
jgi:hypothetical protein